MEKNKYKVENYEHLYGGLMHFNKNKDKYIHGWYPFVEGYSKHFILSIINELNYRPQVCLDPFSGSGTTPLELQKLGIKCHSFEVSPFMFDLSCTKMSIEYDINEFLVYIERLKKQLENPFENIYDQIQPPNFRTIVEKDNIKKWNFDNEVMKGLLDIKLYIEELTNPIYKRLLKIALASILLKVSNVYRNGKCLSYKKNWNKIETSRKDVHNTYLDVLNNVFAPDIRKLTEFKKHDDLYSNAEFCKLGDVRKNIELIENNSIDLVITSPPYLNSRDYTDTYMLELRMLDYIKNLDEISELRSKTIRSHVQVKWDSVKTLDINLLKDSISSLTEFKDYFWNGSLLDMINGYFYDMNILFENLYFKLKKDKFIYFNVANSAYYGVEIKTDEIVAEIAEKNGFSVIEIREARKIAPSSQQRNKIPFLRESVIVIKK